LPRAVEDDALDAGAGQMAQRLAQGLPRAAVDVDRVGHVLVGQPALLRDALGREEVPEALSRRRLLRELDDLDRSFAGQALEQQVGQTERDAQTLGERSLAQGAALTDGGEDLEVALRVALHGTVRRRPDSRRSSFERSVLEHAGPSRVKKIFSLEGQNAHEV